MLPRKIPSKLSNMIKSVIEEVKQEYINYMSVLGMHMIFSMPFEETDSLRPKELKPE